MSDNIIVNVEFLADKFGVDVRTIQNWAAYNGLPKNDRGEYPYLACLEWYIDKQKKDIEDLQKENPLTVARKEAIELNNQRKTLQLQKEQGSLVEKDLVEMAFVSIVKMLMRNVESIAPRLTKKLGGSAKELAIIREEIEDYKNLCANTPLNYFEDEFEQQLQEGDK